MEGLVLVYMYIYMYICIYICMVRLVRSGEEGPFPSTPPTDWQIVSGVVPM